MRSATVAAVLLLGVGAYVAVKSGAIQAASVGEGVSDLADGVSETVSQYLGVDMGSSRYAAALQDPAYADIIAILSAAEARYGIPSGLLVRQAWQESRFNPQAVSPAGAKGLMQFMSATAAEWGVDVGSVESSADGAGRYMQWLYGRLGSRSLALAAYNWGIGNVLRKGLGAAPVETRNYVAQIGGELGLA